MTRFVLLRHDCPPEYRDGPHWDLMLERPSVRLEHRMATWSLLTLPEDWLTRLGRPNADASSSERGGSPSDPVEATKLTDHRAAYLDVTGPIGGGRGSVERWSRGSVEWLSSDNDPAEFRVRIDSEVGHLTGEITLARQSGLLWRLAWRPAG